MKRLVQGGNSDSRGLVFYPFYYVLEGSLERGEKKCTFGNSQTFPSVDAISHLITLR